MRDYTLFIPEYIAAGGAVAVIAVELIWPRVRKDILAYATAIIALAWGVAALFWIGKDPLSFQGLVQVDDFTTFFRVLGAGIVFVTALLSAQFIGERSKVAGEYFGLLLIAGCGMAMMAAARELLTAYLSLEVLSFSLYILVGFYKRDKRSSEASLKYILLGAFASATLLYGISLIYGITGSTYYDGIADGLASRASTARVASGVTSRGLTPVPPTETTRSTPPITAVFRALRISTSSAETTTTPSTTNPASLSSSVTNGPL